MPKPREQHYQDDFNKMRRKITSQLVEVEEFLGDYPVTIGSDILNKILILETGIHIVTLIFNMVKLLFVVISVVIIYSLLMVSIESKTFEIAVQRMVGLNKTGIIQLIIIQSLLYVLPAIIFAFVLATILLHKISDKFNRDYKI